MDEQLDLLYGIEALPTNEPEEHKLKRNWENAFQRWSDRMALDESHPYGCCGYGSICDYCKDNHYGRPCVRALNDMVRAKHLQIDYSKRNFEEIWRGWL